MTWHALVCFPVWILREQIVYHSNNRSDMTSQPSAGILSPFIRSLKFMGLISVSKTDTCSENNIDWLTCTHSKSSSLPASSLETGKTEILSLSEPFLHLGLALGRNSGQQDEEQSAGTALSRFLSTLKINRLMFVATRQEVWDKGQEHHRLGLDIIEPMNKVSNSFLCKQRNKLQVVLDSVIEVFCYF